MNDKLRECPFCGDSVDSPEGVYQNDGSMAYMIQCCNCGLSMFEFTAEKLIAVWNTRHETKHETVEQWEKRRDEIYPDDGAVWVEYRILREDRTEWKLCILKNIKRWDDIASKHNIETSEMCIIANHHGKPEDV